MAESTAPEGPAGIFVVTFRGMHWLDGFHMAWTWFAWLAILGAVVWLGVWAVRSGLGTTHEARETPEEILKRRYAQGEIDQGEYDRRLEALRRP